MLSFCCGAMQAAFCPSNGGELASAAHPCCLRQVCYALLVVWGMLWKFSTTRSLVPRYGGWWRTAYTMCTPSTTSRR